MIESEPIDVIMCTWNSNRPWFHRCLLSIKREVNVQRFIVIDKYSSDATISVIQRVFPSAEVIQTNANLAVARMIGISHVQTEHFAFIDDDVELCKDWVSKLLAIFKNDKAVGAVQGFTRYFIDYLDKIQMSELKFRKESIREITGRGLTHNTIVLTHLVRDFKPSSIVNSWEDFLLTQHVTTKGYKWVEAIRVEVIHYMNVPIKADEGFFSELKKEFKRAKWTGSGARLVNAKTLAGVIFSGFATIYYGVLAMISMLDPRTLVVNTVIALGLLAGFLSLSDISSEKLRQINP